MYKRQKWNSSDKFATYTIAKATSITNTGDVTLNFVNGLTETDKTIAAPGLDVKLHKEADKPGLSAGTTEASWSAFNKGLDNDFTDATAATITMYKVNNSQITVKMTCADAAAFETASGLSIAKIGETDEYTICLLYTSVAAVEVQLLLVRYRHPHFSGKDVAAH